MGGAAGLCRCEAGVLTKFQSQGRFFGGCCLSRRYYAAQFYPGFNRRGDSLGGAAFCLLRMLPQLKEFQSQGRFFGGCCDYNWYWARIVRTSFNRRGDSLGGAAPAATAFASEAFWFQSQGRFFGGCCGEFHGLLLRLSVVSIAGAILWGVLRHREQPPYLADPVSIAGAILWGVLRGGPLSVLLRCRFQSQGRFFGGCCLTNFNITTRNNPPFQSQGRFFGGCC